MPVAIRSLDLFLERFNGVLLRTEGEPPWLRQRRELAMERLVGIGIPSTFDEEYKYTDLSAVADGNLLFGDGAGGADVPSYARHGVAALWFAGPSAKPELKGRPPDGLRVIPLSEAVRWNPALLAGSLASIAPFEQHGLCAENTAFFEDGAYVEVAPGTVVEQPVHLVFGAGARHPRVLISAGRNASVRVVETYAGTGSYWRNAVTEIHAAENAQVDHYRAQVDSLDAYHTGLVQACQERSSNVRTYSLSFGATLARNDIGTRLDGAGCECSVDGLYAVSGSQHVDHHTAIDHAMPHCNSHQLYKGVLDGNAKGVFNGKIFVRRDAQKTDAVQSNKNLLLSDHAEVNTKPQLEIDANDVRCTHGATIGQLDKEAAFYLRSRGIGAARARNLLTYAFAADALARIAVEPLREYFEALLLERFAREEAR